MIIERFPEILELSLEEKRQLVEELKDILESDSDDLELTPEQIKELDRRWESFLADPSSFLTLEEFQDSLDRLMRCSENSQKELDNHDEAELDEFPILASHQDELDRRLQTYLDDPSSISNLEEFQERIKSSIRR